MDAGSFTGEFGGDIECSMFTKQPSVHLRTSVLIKPRDSHSHGQNSSGLPAVRWVHGYGQSRLQLT